MDEIFRGCEHRLEDLLFDADALLGVLRSARQLLDWEGEAIVPAGPEEALADYMAAHRRAAAPTTLALLYCFRRLYGAGVARIRRQAERYAAAVERFAGLYGPGPAALGRAPARINILGEHVDYVDYLPSEVLTFASREHDMLMVFRPNDAALVRGASTLDGTEPAEFPLAQAPAYRGNGGLQERWLEFLHETGTPSRHWTNYVKAGVFYCALKHPGLERGFDFLLDSTIPSAGGASSSSTIVVLSGAAFRAVNGVSFSAETLAQDSAKAEYYIGTRGGNMDHCTMCLSRRQNALHLNFEPFRTEGVPLHRFRYRWMAFFSHPADKGGDVLLKFNERSAVSRLLIPPLLKALCDKDPEARSRWERACSALREDPRDAEAGRAARAVLERLPDTVTLGQMRVAFPDVCAALERSYPRLAQAMEGQPIKVRDRALHHAGEIARVREAVGIFEEVFNSRMPEAPEKTEPALRAVGDVLTQTHESLRDLYGVSTPDIEALVEILLGHPGVYGARLMGGGFGGNVLALVSKEHVAELVDRAQRQYYAPRKRDALAEGSITVSTPGEGFGLLCLRSVLRQTVVNGSAVWWKWDAYGPAVEQAVRALLGSGEEGMARPRRPVQPVVVAGGRGRLDLDGAYRSPASLNLLGEQTSLERVLDAIRGLPFETRRPVVVVSPAMEQAAASGLALPADADRAVQPRPLGTGNAVLAALPLLPASGCDVLVVWGSQPLLTTETLLRSILAHQALDTAAMLFPTAVTRTPYAPIQRDLHGFVTASRETGGGAPPTRRLGETNVGAFVLRADALAQTLAALHEELWDEPAGKYRTTTGELGFPNEMAGALVRQGRAVIALPIAAEEESLGLRDRAGYEEALRLFNGRQRQC